MGSVAIELADEDTEGTDEEKGSMERLGIVNGESVEDASLLCEGVAIETADCNAVPDDCVDELGFGGGEGVGDAKLL